MSLLQLSVVSLGYAPAALGSISGWTECQWSHGHLCVWNSQAWHQAWPEGFVWAKAGADGERCCSPPPLGPAQIDLENAVRARVGSSLYRHPWGCPVGFLDPGGHINKVSSAHRGHPEGSCLGT